MGKVVSLFTRRVVPNWVLISTFIFAGIKFRDLEVYLFKMPNYITTF